jgi:hypothetical protein
MIAATDPGFDQDQAGETAASCHKIDGRRDLFTGPRPIIIRT